MIEHIYLKSKTQMPNVKSSPTLNLIQGKYQNFGLWHLDLIWHLDFDI